MLALSGLALCALLLTALAVPAHAQPVITSAPPPNGTLGVPYSYTVHATGMFVLYSTSVNSLPPGLTIGSSTGIISGTPTVAGIFTGLIVASSPFFPKSPAIQLFTIVIAAGGRGQVITFLPLVDRALSNLGYGLIATATSGLTVSFASLTPATCFASGNFVYLVAVGTCTIRASQAGDANYDPAPNVDQSFNITSALLSQTITFAALSDRPLSAGAFTVSATASSGLPITFSSLTTPVCTVSGNTVTPLVLGTCTIRASQIGNATYAPAPNVDQSFGIVTSLASQTIDFATLANQVFGAAPFVASATASSNLPVSFASLTSSVCVLNGTTVTVIAVGTCTIRASQAGNGTYLPAPNVDRSFTVGQASQTINFPSIGNTPLGTSPREIIAIASSGLPVGAASLTPAVCRVNGVTFETLSTGTCTIRVSQVGSANYSGAPNVEQSFMVTPSAQSLLFVQPSTQSLTHPQFSPSATASSGLPVTFSSSTPSVCTAAGSVVTLVAAGTCTIRATQVGNATYAAVSVDRSFDVLASGAAIPLTVQPGPMLAYSTLLGGFNSGVGGDKAFDIVVAPDGSAYVGGSVAGSYFPGISSATTTNGGLDLMYVAKLNPTRGRADRVMAVGARSSNMTGTGVLPYVGTFETDLAEAMAIDSAGNVYAAAYVNSVAYPVTGGIYARSGSKAIFRIAVDGSIQALGTVIDPAVKSIRALAVDTAGGVYFTGAAAQGLATTANAVIPSSSAPAGGPYLIKLAPGGASVAYATYLSVSGSRSSVAPDSLQSSVDTVTTAYALVIDAAGNAYVAGQARANDFPVTPGAPDTYDDQNRDAFVAKINSAGSALLWVARLGGTDAERATSIALSPDGGIVIGGKSATDPFLGTPTAFQSEVQFTNGEKLGAREVGFVAKLSADGSRWIFVAPIGAGTGNLVRNVDADPLPVRVAVDPAGAIYAAGYAVHRLPVGAIDELGRVQIVQSPAYYDDGALAVLYGFDAYFRAGGGFLMKISPNGSRLIYSVIVNYGPVVGLAVDAYGAAYVTGYEAGLPQIDAAQAAPGSVFVAKVLDQSMPLLLTSTPNPSTAVQSVTLSATVGDARYAGSIEFRDGAQVLATVPLAGGAATFAISPTIGIHRLNATLHGGGPFDGAAALEVIHVVNQATP